MRFLIQRVSRASVTVEGRTVGRIDRGLLVFVGIRQDDTESEADWLVQKALSLRIWPNEQGQMDRSVQEVDGGVLAVSQFTLYGDMRRGRRPDFTQAAHPDVAKPLFEAVLERFRCSGLRTESGVFGAHMEVELLNDGPVTLLLERTPQGIAERE